MSGSWKMSHPRLPEISQISGLPHQPADSQHCKISKISREWEHRDLEWKQSVNYVNEKTFWLVPCRQVSLKPDAGWKMSVAMKFIQDAKQLSMASSKSWIQTNRIHSVHDGIKIQLSMPDFDWSRKIQIISDEVDAFKE